MKVIFQGNHTADVSEIQSVSVIPASKRIEVHLKRKTGETEEKVCDLIYPGSRYARRLLPKLAETIKEELVSLSTAPDMPIEQVIKLTAWRRGHLQVRMDTDSRASTQGLASLCWHWSLGRKPKDEELELRTGLSADDIEKIASPDIYKQSIKDLMLESYDTPDKFKWWLRDWIPNMPAKLGEHMRISENTATELINSGAEQYNIDLGNLTGSWSLSKSERTIGSGRNSVYLYYYQWDRDSAESKGQSVWECKIGKTTRPLQKRLREQATDPENFKIGLHIKTDKPKETEDIIKDTLKERKKHLCESLRTEWFRTNPSEVEEIYNFIGESSRESAS